jgi:hypothetical protein
MFRVYWLWAFTVIYCRCWFCSWINRDLSFIYPTHFDIEDGGSMYLRNVGNIYTSAQCKDPKAKSYSWELRLSQWWLWRDALWDITPCSPVKLNRRFRGTCGLHLQGRRVSQARNQRETGSKLARLTSTGLHGLISQIIIFVFLALFPFYI